LKPTAYFSTPIAEALEVVMGQPHHQILKNAHLRLSRPLLTPVADQAVEGCKKGAGFDG